MPYPDLPPSFDAFLATMQPNTALSSVALAYWQDYKDGRPIDGGVAFESTLRKIPLDGSMQSLSILDKFLDKAKLHLAPDSVVLSQRSDQRNLLLFIGFYVGLVLAYQASRLHQQSELQADPDWSSHAQLCHTFPPLSKLIDDDLSYSIAISLLPITDSEQPFIPSMVSATVFFPLVTIIERLYPRRQHALMTTAPHFGFVSDSLATSVEQMLARWQPLEMPNVFQTAQPNPESTPNTLQGGLENSLDSEIATTQTAPSIDHFHERNPVLHNENSPVISDLDNPLLDRKTDDDTLRGAELAAQPVITYHAYVMPDFSQTSMIQQDDTVVLDANDDITASQSALTPNVIELSSSILSSPDSVDTSEQPTTQTAPSTHRKQNLNRKTVNSKKLNSRQAIAEAKAQAKVLEKQRLEEQARLEAEAQAKRQAEIAEALVNPRLHEGLLNQRKSMVSTIPRLQDSFTELEQDLQDIVLPDTLGENIRHAYEQAVILLSNPQDLQHVPKALAVVQKLADANISDALLRQALLLLRGNRALNIIQDADKGLALVKQAAQLQDGRAEKLLSKLYFSGELVGNDREQGKYWLAQAAAHGHAEAQKLQQSFMLVGTLKETRQDEDNYFKKLTIGTTILLVFMLIIIFALKV